jgi:glucosamine kinase|tara:strand:- start:11686 stop:11901 length:216 start_codon:yes stop_codon:yes gene_type:complete
MQKLILDCLDEFFDLHISCFENYENHKINFIGSVAYFLQEELEVIATKYNCKLGMVIKNPIDKLIEYHFKK